MIRQPGSSFNMDDKSQHNTAITSLITSHTCIHFAKNQQVQKMYNVVSWHIWKCPGKLLTWQCDFFSNEKKYSTKCDFKMLNGIGCLPILSLYSCSCLPWPNKRNMLTAWQLLHYALTDNNIKRTLHNPQSWTLVKSNQITFLHVT